MQGVRCWVIACVNCALGILFYYVAECGTRIVDKRSEQAQIKFEQQKALYGNTHLVMAVIMPRSTRLSMTLPDSDGATRTDDNERTEGEEKDEATRGATFGDPSVARGAVFTTLGHFPYLPSLVTCETSMIGREGQRRDAQGAD